MKKIRKIKESNEKLLDALPTGERRTAGNGRNTTENTRKLKVVFR
jgi:hypothetical protein